MRLLVVSQYFWPENFRINDLVAELVVRGHDVTILTGVPNYPDGRVFPAYRHEPRQFVSYSGAKVVRVPLIPRGRSRLFLVLNYLSFAATASLIGTWKLRRLRFDAMFVYQTSPVTVGLPAVLLRAIKRVPLAFWVLDLWPDTLQAIGVVRSRWLLRSVGLLVSFIYNRCDLILTPSRSAMPQIAKRCRNAGRIAYFPSWAESVFDFGSEAAAPELPPKGRMFDIMFAGNIGEAQDFPAVLAAAELLRGHAEIRWLIVGDGRMAPWVAKEIERRNLGQCVLMLGSHPLQRMPAFYRHADALLVCLKDEPIFSMTIPGKLQSYLTAGIPVVAMLNGEGAEVVKRSRCGVTCRAGDAQGLAAAVLSLAQSPEEQRRQMGRNALIASETEFDRSRLIAQLESWLQGMSARSNANAR